MLMYKASVSFEAQFSAKSLLQKRNLWLEKSSDNHRC